MGPFNLGNPSEFTMLELAQVNECSFILHALTLLTKFLLLQLRIIILIVYVEVTGMIIFVSNIILRLIFTQQD